MALGLNARSFETHSPIANGSSDRFGIQGARAGQHLAKSVRCNPASPQYEAVRPALRQCRAHEERLQSCGDLQAPLRAEPKDLCAFGQGRSTAYVEDPGLPSGRISGVVKNTPSGVGFGVGVIAACAPLSVSSW